MEHTEVKNYVIGVMDDEVERYLVARGSVNWFRVNLPVPKILDKTHPANRVGCALHIRMCVHIQYMKPANPCKCCHTRYLVGAGKLS